MEKKQDGTIVMPEAGKIGVVDLQLGVEGIEGIFLVVS